MKVLLISKDAFAGGAAVAARRLMESLKGRVDIKMLVQENGNPQSGIFDSSPGLFKKIINRIRFILERLTFLPKEKNRSIRFMFSPANTGEDLSGHRLVREADILHLHWVNGGFLSLRSLKKLLDQDKPVVWTFHDMWAFTGGCHLALDCTEYMKSCGNCPYLRKPRTRDLSARLWKKKQKLFSHRNLTIVTPSRWMKECAGSSSLLGHFDISAIPNPVDPEVFHPVERESACRELGLDPGKKYILFGAANVRNMIKGFSYFVEAAGMLHRELEETGSVELILLGRTGGNEAKMFPFRLHTISYTGAMDKVVRLFSIAHLYLISSIQENFPNTIIEAMLCGTPSVGFKTGGIPEMIEHKKDGYLAEHRSSGDLAAGMKWLLDHPDYDAVSVQARQSALERFSMERSAGSYLRVYEKLMDQKARV
jgi:glycosyltransferase involved in cell wall biosynthesis